MKKLSKVQAEVMALLNDGWQIGIGDGRTWVQKGGVGKGGESRPITRPTANSLINLGLIIKVESDRWIIQKYDAAPKAST